MFRIEKNQVTNSVSDMIFLIVCINTYIYTYIHILIYIYRCISTHRKRKEYISECQCYLTLGGEIIGGFNFLFVYL